MSSDETQDEALTKPLSQQVCTTPGCPGDPRYASPGRRHLSACSYPRAQSSTWDLAWEDDEFESDLR